MPVLSNPRHERFANELAKGGGQAEAYARAGYSGNASAASKLLQSNANISERVKELQGSMADETVKSVSVTRAEVIGELAKLGFVPMKDEDVRPADKRAALLNLAQIEGWVVERHEVTGKDGGAIKHDLTVFSDEQLSQLAAILGGVAAVTR